MNYDVILEAETVAQGLSIGELAQWLLDTDKSTEKEKQDKLKKTVDMDGNIEDLNLLKSEIEDFEEYLYKDLEKDLKAILLTELDGDVQKKVHLHYGEMSLFIVESEI